MRRGQFTEDQIIGVLREHEAGVKKAELCRKHGISDATFYNWKAKYGGMTVSEAARLRTLEETRTGGLTAADGVDARRIRAERRGLPCMVVSDNPVLSEHLFPSLAAARRIIEAWRTDYNTVRPHSSLG